VYLAIALPMGMIDALVPFAQELPVWEFEAIVFALSLGFFVIALLATRSATQGISQQVVANV
jgi:hypothetical protein